MRDGDGTGDNVEAILSVENEQVVAEKKVQSNRTRGRGAVGNEKRPVLWARVKVRVHGMKISIHVLGASKHCALVGRHSYLASKEH